jgi:hypothetical protein
MNKNINPYYFGMTVFDSKKLKKPKDVKIYNYSENNLAYFLSKGYKIKAKSAFTERNVHMDWAKLSAKQLGAPIMLLKDEYAGSVSGRRTLAFRIPGEKYIVTSNTNSTLNYNSNTDAYAVGTNGYAFGSSTTTGNANYNSSTKTTIQGPDKYGYKSIAYKNNYYDYYAIYLVKKYIEGDKKAPKKFIKKRKLKYSGDTFLKKKPEYKSKTIKSVNDTQIIYVIKQNISKSAYSKVYVSGHYGYIISALIK